MATAGPIPVNKTRRQSNFPCENKQKLTHDFGVDSDRGEGYEPSHDGQTFGVGVRTPREDHAPGAVGDLRRVSRGGGSALLENGRQLGEGIL